MLPAYQVNPMLVDFSPVSNALAGYQKQMNTNDQLDMQQKRLDMETERFQDQKRDSVRQRLGNVALLTLQEADPTRRAQKWQQVIQTHPEAATLDAKYHDPSVGPMAVLGDAKMAQEYLNSQLQKAAEGRAAAAEGRAAAMHAPNLQTAQVQAEAAKRDFNTPKVGSADLAPDHARVFYDPRTGLETGRLEGPKKGIDKDVASIEHQLRGEVAGLAKDYRVVRDSSANVEALSKNPSAASDIALIFQYMKILDPASVVREGEFATAQNAAGVPDRIMNIYNRIISGQRLNESQRADFVSQARTLAGTKLDQYRRDIDQYRAVAERSKVNPANVILDRELLSPPGVIAQGNAGQGFPGGRLPAAQQAYDEARKAISAGANRGAVIQRLRENGIDPSGL